jgi:hypothetical protein
MYNKLTLSLDSDIIEFAHDYSAKMNKSISKIVENYFSELQKEEPASFCKEVEALYGILDGEEVPDKKVLRKDFHEKDTH